MQSGKCAGENLLAETLKCSNLSKSGLHGLSIDFKSEFTIGFGFLVNLVAENSSEGFSLGALLDPNFVSSGILDPYHLLNKMLPRSIATSY